MVNPRGHAKTQRTREAGRPVGKYTAVMNLTMTAGYNVCMKRVKHSARDYQREG